MNNQEFGPKIFHQADTGAEGGLSPQQENLLFSQDKDRDLLYVEKSFALMVDELKKLDKAKEEKKPEIREKLRDEWENLMTAQLMEVENVLDDNLLRFRSAYPYDSRVQEMWFGGLNKVIRKMKREPWARDEARKWLDRVETDMVWGDSNFKIVEGVGTVLPSFFNWSYMLNWVRERMRTDPIAAYYEQTFSEKLPGISPPDDLGVPLFRAEGGGERKGLREKAIKYQDESVYWRMAVAAVSQADYSKEGEPPSTFMNLAPQEIEFIQRLFVERKEDENEYVQYKGNEVPASILNWYASGQTIEKKRQYISLMKALLATGAKDRLTNLINSGGDINELIGEVENIVYGRTTDEELDKRTGGLIEHWYSQELPLDYKLASVIVKSGIIMDWGHMSSGRMGWRWEYSEENGEIVRKLSTGGTTAATDVVAPTYWRFQHSGNEKKNYPGGMFPSMSADYIKELEINTPDWKNPNVNTETVMNANPSFRNAWKRLWRQEDGWTWPEDLKEGLENNVWYWETGYEEGGKPIYFPVFFPPEIASLNFWNTITLSDDKEKVWQKLGNGEKLSQLNWEKMGDQALYRWMITIGQINRFLTVMLEPQTKANEGQFMDFFSSPGKITELFKRVKLGVRDEIGPAKDLTLALAPMLIVLNSADKYGILGEAGSDRDIMAAWAREMARWETKASGLNDDDYAYGFTRLIRFYATLIAKMAKIDGEKKDRQAQDILKEIRSTIKQDAGVPIEDSVVHTKPDLR